MSRVVLYCLSSLDGAVDSPDRYFPETPDRVGPPVFDERLIELETAMIARQSAVLLGRGMYDEWARYWPTSDEQPFADFINGVTKYVVTSSPLTGGWQNSEPVSGSLEQIVTRLKQSTDGDIGVHGSIVLARSLLDAGLVDEICLGVGRVIDPTGRRLFSEMSELIPLELIEATPTPSGSVWLRYAVHRNGQVD